MENNNASLKVVLITGASSGIGLAAAELLAEKKGYRVFGTSRTQTESSIPGVEFACLDLNKPESINECIKTIHEQTGGIDVLINNAGLGLTGPAEETPLEEAEKIFQTNFFGTCRMINQVLPIMRNQGSGRIINVTSIAGYMGLPYRGYYSSTKAALANISEAFRMETKSFGIKVSCLAPGDIATDIASRRYDTPAHGDSPYHSSSAPALSLMNEQVSSGMAPRKVAEKIFQIMQSQNPKPHYTIGGFQEKLAVQLKKFIPGKWYEKMLMNYYKL